MTIQKLERVMWRIRKDNPGENRPTNASIERAIIRECGTDPKTYRNNRRALLKLQWLKVYNSTRCELTNVDITGG